ncbi:heterokaryon incompatibility protein [Paraphaeosphaeria minitans]|uniref:Heterokaryon incompatibility protein n=1 Tax=Paraphaeosphaeria minitans TaxID=565426 RepID=A0A9P6GGU8_9PLEO|nr:heterokaryon incompatibility protein [Paraphaeosphaeria minitans]
MRALPMDDLSPTFRDAIMFTRRLGMRFIWIDSLCILQDSPEDWMAESSVMNRVYKHSVCNIAATTVSYRSPGLYKRRDPRMVTPYKTRIQRSGHKRPYVYSLGGDTYHRAVSRADINSRVWVFQERMLSPRTLHFSTQLFWECRMLHACETYPTGFPRVPTSAGFDSDPPWSNCKLWMKDLQTDATSTWQSLVQTYCTSHFTQQRDRLAALAGLVQEIHTYTNDEYLAGLWKKELPHALCWMLYGTLQSSDITRANEYRCKSFSRVPAY